MPYDPLLAHLIYTDSSAGSLTADEADAKDLAVKRATVNPAWWGLKTMLTVCQPDAAPPGACHSTSEPV